MRILHFLPVYAPAWQFGGPILSVSRLCEGLAQLGDDVRVITTNAGLPDFPHDQLCVPQDVNGVQVIYYPVDHASRTIRSSALIKALPEHMSWAQLLHLSSIWHPLGLHVQEAAHSFNIPVFQTLRGALGPYSWRRGWWKKIPYFWFKERPLLQRSVALHCTSRQESSEIAWLALRPPIRYLPNPMDFSKLFPSRQLGENWRQQLGIPFSEPLFLVTGRLHHKKGLELLPNVLQAIAHKPWQIVFIGSDDDGTGLRLMRQFDRAGLADRCLWIQHMPADHLSGPYNAADFLLLPSRHENFGNVVIEALSCGCGALISDLVGVSSDIKNCPGVNIVPRQKQAWISGLLALVSTPRPGRLAANYVTNRYSIPCVAKQCQDIYTSLLSNE